MAKKEKEKLKWEKVPGRWMTPGGDPFVRCPICKDRSSHHCEGVEHTHWNYCPHCGKALE